MNQVRTWVYADEWGNKLHRVVNLGVDPATRKKKIRQQRWNGTWWEWGVGENAKHVPYKVQELICAVKSQRRVFVPEGEKCCDLLAALGLDATTNRGGAGKWTAEDGSYFVDADAVILPDCNDSGRNHAAMVHRSLVAAGARSVRLLELPDLEIGEDVEQWLARGGTREQLEALADAAPTSVPDGWEVPPAQKRTAPGTRPKPRPGTDPVRAATEEFNEGNIAWLRSLVPNPRKKVGCPACESEDGFMVVDTGLDWRCFSSRHGEREPMCGTFHKGEHGSYFWGDALDLDSHLSGIGRLEVLRREGLLDQAEPTATEPERRTAPPAPWRDGPFRSLADEGFSFDDAPPERDFLLRQGPDPKSPGLMPDHEPALLFGDGERGKGFVTLDLAASVAAGIPWLGRYHVARPGNVLLFSLEDDRAEVTARLHEVVKARKLDPQSKALLTERLCIPGVAADAGLTFHEGDHVAAVLRAMEGRDFSLVIVDPLSYVAGDAETDNPAATRLVREVRRIAQGPGRPAVLMVHHEGKSAQFDSGAKASRGSSALYQGMRFVARLQQAPDADAVLSVEKSNRGAKPEPLKLWRQKDSGALLPEPSTKHFTRNGAKA